MISFMKEDHILIKCVENGPDNNWSSISAEFCKESKARKTAKQCRERYTVFLFSWFNKLKPGINNSEWTIEEEEKLLELHFEYGIISSYKGNQWIKISKLMEGRSENCVKNRFYSILKKGFRKINQYIIKCKRKLKAFKNKSLKEINPSIL